MHAMRHLAVIELSCISDCVGTQFGTVRCAVTLFNCYFGGRYELNEPAQLASSTIVSAVCCIELVIVNNSRKWRILIERRLVRKLLIDMSFVSTQCLLFLTIFGPRAY